MLQRKYLHELFVRQVSFRTAWSKTVNNIFYFILLYVAKDKLTLETVARNLGKNLHYLDKEKKTNKTKITNQKLQRLL